MGREEATLRRILGKSWNTLSFVRRDALVAALRSAHASGAREAEEKRHPGSEPPDTGRDVIAVWNDGTPQQASAAVWYEGDRWLMRGVGVNAPDFWFDLPDTLRVETK